MEVRLGTPLTADMVRAEARRSHRGHGKRAGANGDLGIDHDFVVTPQDVLEGKVSVGERVAVIGGGMVGCETANHLAHHGKKPTIIEMLSDLAPAKNR